MNNTIINAESIKATGIEPKGWEYNRDGNVLRIELTYKDRQEAVSAMKEFLALLDMDRLPEKIDLKVVATEISKTTIRVYKVVETIAYEDRPWA